MLKKTSSIAAKLYISFQTGGPRLFCRRLESYIEKFQRQRILLKSAAILSAESALDLDGPTVLITDHDNEGGSHFFRLAREKQWLANGVNLLLWQYLPGHNRYLLTAKRAAKKDTVFQTASLRLIKAVLNRIAISDFFCNHLVGWPDLYDTMDIIKRLPAEQHSIWLHDFFTLCPSYNLINNEGLFCSLPSDPGLCNACLKSSSYLPDFTDTDILLWRKKWLDFLLDMDVVMAPDESVRDLFAKVYPQGPPITVEPLSPITSWTPLDLPVPDEVAVIGVVGRISRPKGAQIVEDLAQLIDKERLKLKILVIGELDSGFKSKSLKVLGAYRHEELPDLILRHKVNVALVPSVCPETFCYVAQELTAMDIPLVCFDIGAQGRRVRQYGKGAVAGTISARSCLEAIISMLKKMDRRNVK